MAKKNKAITIRVTEFEFGLLHLLSDERNQSITRSLQIMMREEAKRRGIFPMPPAGDGNTYIWTNDDVWTDDDTAGFHWRQIDPEQLPQVGSCWIWAGGELKFVDFDQDILDTFEH